MKFTLLDNAVDSLNATHSSIQVMLELTEGHDHRIKDAILSINHAAELLFKYLLKSKNEYLVFKDLTSYMKAKEEMIKQKKNSIFEVSPNIQTVGFSEAIRRLELLCDIEVPQKFKKAMTYLNKKRNEIMHYEINLSVEEAEKVYKQLTDCYELSIEYFSKHIPNLEDMVGDARFEFHNDDLFDEPDVEAMVDDAYYDSLDER
ncbi:hypothetical protein [Bacillus safensis]|uniref:hypothetical protein n=1 Tax=Bacillus safensis TaxID=561879 RepID=UPI00148ED91B|nr:hypothetical protein [Bacillus safensis]NOL36816.1 hypothetical protein [Bacillus safensis]